MLLTKYFTQTKCFLEHTVLSIMCVCVVQLCRSAVCISVCELGGAVCCNCCLWGCLYSHDPLLLSSDVTVAETCSLLLQFCMCFSSNTLCVCVFQIVMMRPLLMC